jgi:adenosylcobinamide-GDP ribazoletransferase
MNMFKQQLTYLASAVMYLTRLPVPSRLTKANPPVTVIAPYFPVVGVLVGSIGALTFQGVAAVLPHEIAILMSMATTIYMTGAFHEDGFADVCDGFGGGWDKERILLIMKDSRIGSFAAVGIVLILGLKYQSLMHISVSEVAKMLIAGHAISRAMPVAMSCFLENARDVVSRTDAKPMFQSQSLLQGGVAMLFGMVPLIVLHGGAMFWLLAPLVAVTFLMARFFKHWIGGYTGDCCGAVQQVTEVVFYLSVIALRNVH